jgi:hypothetical protein
MSPAHDTLLSTLRRARRFLLWRALERAGLAIAVGLFALALVTLAVGLLTPLHRAEYAVIRVVLIGTGALLCALGAAGVVRSRARLRDAALEAGRLLGERDDELLTALELLGEGTGADAGRARGASSSPRYSDDLRAAAVRAASDRAAAAPIARLRLWNARGRWLTAAGATLVLVGVTGALGGAKTARVIRYIANPAGAPAAPIAIRVEPGSREIEGGESVPVRAYVRGTGQRPHLKVEQKGAWTDVTLDDSEDLTDARPGERSYALTLRNLKEDLRYRVRAGDQETPVYALTVRDLPRATGYRIRYDYPAYTGLKAEESHAITGDLAAPRGTRARVEVTLSRGVTRATALLDQAGGRIEGAPGERLAGFTVPVRADDRYTIRLGDARGRRVDLGPFEIRAIPDRPPTVGILAPGPVEDVARDMTAVVIAGATDDYGVRKILLKFKVRDEAERIEALHEEKGGARELAVRYTWTLGSYSLLPGEEIEYRIGAVDGNAIDGPQTAWSEARVLRFPSAAEILASMSQDRDEAISTLENVLEDARELQRKSEELSRDLGRSREMTWEKRQEAQKTLEGQQALRDQIDKVAEKLGQDAEKLAQSRALNAELAQKILELHQVLSQIKDQALQRSIQRLQDALKKLSPQEMERALQNMKLSQEEILKSLERTIEMLKQIRMEEKLEAASERAAEMERRQIALNDSLARAKRPEEAKALGPNERQIDRMSQEERAALDSLASELRAMDRQTAEQADQLADSLGSREARQDFQEATRSLEQGDRSEARERTQSVRERLERLRQGVDEMRESFLNRKKSELAKKMEDAAQDLLEIGKIQEKMLDDEASSLSQRAETQKGLEDATRSATNRIGEIAKQTMFLTPDIAQALGRALSNQQNAVGRYSQQDLGGGLMAGKEASISLSQAAAGLLKGKESMQGSRSSTGFQEAMQRLQGLAGEQQSLNQQALGLMPGGEEGESSAGQGGRMSEGEGDALARMAAEQEAIRRGLEETMDQLGKGGGTLGKLGDVADEMKKVEEALRGGRLDQETAERQQRILSRLLDAPRSVEKRDYSRRRTSRPGVDVVRSSPGALSPELLKTRPSLAALLARAGRDPVTPRYRALVDEYLQSVLEGKGR